MPAPSQANVTIPGTKKKVPRAVLLIGAGVGGLVLFLVLRGQPPGGGGGGAPAPSGEGGGDGTTPSDLESRFAEERRAFTEGMEDINRRLAEIEQQRPLIDTGAPPVAGGGGPAGEIPFEGGLPVDYGIPPMELPAGPYAETPVDFAPATTPVVTPEQTTGVRTGQMGRAVSDITARPSGTRTRAAVTAAQTRGLTPAQREQALSGRPVQTVTPARPAQQGQMGRAVSGIAARPATAAARVPTSPVSTPVVTSGQRQTMTQRQPAAPATTTRPAQPSGTATPFRATTTVTRPASAPVSRPAAAPVSRPAARPTSTPPARRR